LRSRSGSCSTPSSSVALAVGVLFYAFVVLLILDPLDTGIRSGVLRIGWLATAVTAVLVVGLIRGRLSARPGDGAGARRAAIVVWALSEGQALVGITGTFLTGDRMLTVLALALFALALALFAWLWFRYPPKAFASS
jgi:hypothetical protein